MPRAKLLQMRSYLEWQLQIIKDTLQEEEVANNAGVSTPASRKGKLKKISDKAIEGRMSRIIKNQK